MICVFVSGLACFADATAGSAAMANPVLASAILTATRAARVDCECNMCPPVGVVRPRARTRGSPRRRPDGVLCSAASAPVVTRPITAGVNKRTPSDDQTSDDDGALAAVYAVSDACRTTIASTVGQRSPDKGAGLSQCAREDSNVHGPYGPQGPQPDSVGV